MQRFCALLLSILVLVASAVPTSAQTPPAAGSQCPPAPSVEHVADDGQSYVFVAKGQAYEVLSGNRALRHLSDKRLRHPERFLAMGSALASRGYRPTDKIVVERSLGPAHAAIPGYDGRESGEPALAATGDWSWQGEQIFWSWTDGNNATWEGTQYVERYSDRSWVVYDGQLDISNTNGNVVWSHQTAGGGPGLEHQASLRGGRAGLTPRLAAIPGGAGPAGINQEFKDWAICILGGCLGCAGGCLFTGPAYPACYGACCFGVSVTCALEYYFR